MDRITIADVARHAGVSQTTVSRVLNQDPAVKKLTREKVMRSIKLLRYQPNQAARSLAGRRAARIGIYFEKPYGGYTAELLVAALRECSHRGHMLVAEELPKEISTHDFIVDIEQSIGELNAILLPPLSRSFRPIVETMRTHNMPLVALSASESKIHEAGYHTVGIDDFEAAKETTEYLLGLGHKRIAFIRGLSFQLASEERHRGFREAMINAGADVDPALVQEGDFTYNSGMRAMRQILGQDDRPTAVFASNDDMAAGAIGVAFQMGLRVPEDVSIIGFDDSPMAQSVSPNLTSVQQPVPDMVRTALDVLEHHPNFPGANGRSDPPEPSHHSVSHRLTKRDSAIRLT